MYLPHPIENGKAVVYFSLGSNLGNREQNIHNALQMLEQHIGSPIRRSAFFYSEPWGFQSPHSFCNICASFFTPMCPSEVLCATQKIERTLGRTHKSQHGHYHDRLIDIDMLLYITPQGHSLSIQTPDLTLPHPLMHLRPFVMTPLLEILPLPTIS